MTTRILRCALLGGALLLPATVYAQNLPAVGSSVKVDWKGKPYDARVLKRDGNRVFVHYEGWTSAFDEWITADRLIIGSGARPQADPKQSRSESIWVNWNGKAYKATVVKREGRRLFVQYDGWPSNYDEWITEDKIITEKEAQRIGGPTGSGARTTSNSDPQKETYEKIDKLREEQNRRHQESEQRRREEQEYYERQRRNQ